MDDAGFWAGVEDLLKFMKPFMMLMRKVDGDTPMIGKLYNECFQVCCESQLAIRLYSFIKQTDHTWFTAARVHQHVLC